MSSGPSPPLPALEHQTRNTKLVTRVVKATLFALVAANLLLALFGLGLAVVAYSTLVSERGVRDLQARLGTAGMVAQIFEGYRDKEVTSLEDLFGKRTIGSSRKGGKWSFSGL